MFPYNENKTCNFSPYKRGDVGGGGVDGMGISQFWKSYVDALIFFQLSDLGEGGGYTLVLKKNLFEKKIYKVPEYDVIC